MAKNKKSIKKVSPPLLLWVATAGVLGVVLVFILLFAGVDPVSLLY